MLFLQHTGKHKCEPCNLPVIYVWADGVYSGLRAEQLMLCSLVAIGVNERVKDVLWRLRTGCGNPRRAGVKCCCANTPSKYRYNSNRTTERIMVN